MKLTLCLAQPRILPGCLENNYKNIRSFVQKALIEKADYLFFPAQALTGNNIGVLEQHADFRRQAANMRLTLQQSVHGRMKIVFADEYDLCGNLISPNCLGIDYLGKAVTVHNGGSTAYDIENRLVVRGKYFAEDFITLNFDTETMLLSSSQSHEYKLDDAAAICQTLYFGAKEFLHQQGLTKITLGLSGGIDSAVAAALYAKILGPENVLCLNLPGPYNADLTKTLAKEIASNLGTPFGIVPITDSVNNTIQMITELGLTVDSLGEENIQARERSTGIIAAAAASFGGGFSANSNKAELSVGYSTFYGDLTGALAILGDLWKYQVYALGRYLNDMVYHRQVIPEAVFQIRPSAELSEEQTVGKGGDPLYYPYHDYLLNAFTKGTSLTNIALWYRDGLLEEKIGCREDMSRIIFKNSAKLFFDDLEHWWKQYHGLAVAKRLQAPPVIAVSDHPFGVPEPQIPSYFSKEYLDIKETLIKQ